MAQLTDKGFQKTLVVGELVDDVDFENGDFKDHVLIDAKTVEDIIKLAIAPMSRISMVMEDVEKFTKLNELKYNLKEKLDTMAMNQYGE